MDDYTEIRSLNKAWSRVLRWLSYRSRSKKETETYLRDKGFEESIVEAVLDRLTYLGYVDDKTFTEEYLRSCLRRGYGPRKARWDLLQKGINLSLVEERFEEYFNPEEDYRRAKELLDRRLGRIEGELSEKDLRKNANFLLRRGFYENVVKKVLCSYEHRQGSNGTFS